MPLFDRMPSFAMLIVCFMTLLPRAAETKERGPQTDPPSPQTAPPAKSLPIPKLEIPLINQAPIIDGDLSDPAWQKSPLPLGEWLSYNPLYGTRMTQRTTVWAAYDRASLYFAFHCTDPEPDKIKSAISRRDTIWNDDWIGLSLDALGSHQSSYEFSRVDDDCDQE